MSFSVKIKKEKKKKNQGVYVWLVDFKLGTYANESHNISQMKKL